MDHASDDSAPSRHQPLVRPFTAVFEDGCSIPATRDEGGVPSSVRYLDIAGHVLSLLLVLYTAARWAPTYFDPYRQNDDTRYMVLAFPGWLGPAFEGDYLTEAIPVFAPVLHRTLMEGLLALGLDYLLLTKLLQMTLVGWAALHAFRMGHRRAGGMGGLLGLFLALHCYPLLNRTAGALPRAFGIPVLMMAVDGMDARKPWLAGAGVLLGFALYPSAGLVGALAFGAWSLVALDLRLFSNGSMKRILVPLVATAFISLLLVIPLLLPVEGYGHVYTYEEAQAMPEFSEEGRVALVPFAPLRHDLARLNFHLSMHSEDATTWISLFRIDPESRIFKLTLFDLLVLATIPLIVLGRVRLSPLPFLVGLLGLLGYFLAKRVAFRFYIPDRLLLTSVSVASIVYLTTVFSRLRARSGDPRWPRWGALFAVIAFSAVLGPALPPNRGLTVNASGQRELYKAVSLLPEDAIIAGNPWMMSNIPLWSKRRIIACYETSLIWYSEMWPELKARNIAQLEALYATDLEPVRDIVDRYGVSHMIIDQKWLNRPFEPIDYFEPLESYYREKTKGVQTADLIWSAIPEPAIVDKVGRYLLVDLVDLIHRLEENQGQSTSPDRTARPGTDA